MAENLMWPSENGHSISRCCLGIDSLADRLSHMFCAFVPLTQSNPKKKIKSMLSIAEVFKLISDASKLHLIKATYLFALDYTRTKYIIFMVK